MGAMSFEKLERASRDPMGKHYFLTRALRGRHGAMPEGDLVLVGSVLTNPRVPETQGIDT
jgi:hypothetical protein